MAPTKKTTASEKRLEDMFLDGLKDIYYAEKKILKALPKMAKSAENEQVSAAFEKHRAETEGQVERLEEVFEILGMAARGKTCPAINGILEGRHGDPGRIQGLAIHVSRPNPPSADR